MAIAKAKNVDFIVIQVCEVVSQSLKWLKRFELEFLGEFSENIGERATFPCPWISLYKEIAQESGLWPGFG